MKTTRLVYLIATAFLFVFASCKKDDNSSSSSSSPTVGIVTQGQWQITSFTENGINHTNHFTGHSFTFASNGALSATNGTVSATGSWSTATDDSQQKLVINFNSTPTFSELNSDWHIITQTSSKVTLEDVSGGGSGTDYLTFEKL
ncbi:MAG TPA: hypothetical protein PKX15_05550 [Bacteroidales bacterium]|jgi:hypothetical protein|nr:hypothetical protein [Bacteroidales bacterium]HOS47060.1 hypothetical protein [Bacteroidia bacterium]HQF27184.1 hypothetical protein [Bacteroidia bacterium]HQK96526.1 hypothetical protein [Bacteroidia bacterium]